MLKIDYCISVLRAFLGEMGKHVLLEGKLHPVFIRPRKANPVGLLQGSAICSSGVSKCQQIEVVRKA